MRALAFIVVAGVPFGMVLVRTLSGGVTLSELVGLGAFAFLVLNLAGIAAGPPQGADD